MLSFFDSAKGGQLKTYRTTFQNVLEAEKLVLFGGAASKHVGLPVCPPVCLPAHLSVPVSFWTGFVDNTNI